MLKKLSNGYSMCMAGRRASCEPVEVTSTAINRTTYVRNGLELDLWCQRRDTKIHQFVKGMERAGCADCFHQLYGLWQPLISFLIIKENRVED